MMVPCLVYLDIFNSYERRQPTLSPSIYDLCRLYERLIVRNNDLDLVYAWLRIISCTVRKASKLLSRPDLDRPPATTYARTKKRRSRDLPDRQWSHCCNDALAPWAPVWQGNNTTEYYNPLLLYSVSSFLTLCRTLVVNLIY